MKKQSLTIVGLAVAVVGFILNKIGVNLPEGELMTTISTIVQIAGGIIAYIGRVRQGDVNLLGRMKKLGR